MLEGINNIDTSNFSISSPNQVENNNNNNRSFSSMLQDNLEEVNGLQKQADEITTDFTLGKVDNIHDVTIATEKARVALNLTTAIQGKVMDAYKQIMRMQV